MIIEIECYQGDTLLRGKKTGFPVFRAQIAEIEQDYDRNEDNFIALLCRRYHYEVISTDTAVPSFVYDRDKKKAYQVKKKRIREFFIRYIIYRKRNTLCG